MSQHKIRLFVNQPLRAKLSLTLEPQQAHHLVTVMRRKQGDAVQLFNGMDGEWDAVITAIKRQDVTLSLKQQRFEQIQSADVRLLLPELKKERLAWAIEKSCELGASHILLTKTEFSQNHALKVDRLEQIAISASEQCERMSLPAIDALQSLEQRLENWPEQVKLFVCVERNHRAHQRRALLPLLMQNQDKPLAFAIGPEGGWSAQELALFAKHPAVRFVSLGAQVLRAETAAIAALSAWAIVRASLDALYN